MHIYILNNDINELEEEKVLFKYKELLNSILS